MWSAVAIYEYRRKIFGMTYGFAFPKCVACPYPLSNKVFGRPPDYSRRFMQQLLEANGDNDFICATGSSKVRKLVNGKIMKLGGVAIAPVNITDST